MIKNIIFDIGGVIFDDKNDSLSNKFNISSKRAKEISKIAFIDNFNECMKGYISSEDYIKSMIIKYPNIKEELEYILSPKYYDETFPLKKDIYNKIVELYNKGYNLYILTNNTKFSYDYIKNKINLSYFKGVVCSYEEHLIKPDTRIYELILNRYNLNKDETIFFDDNYENVESANGIGLKSVIFNGIEDLLFL